MSHVSQFRIVAPLQPGQDSEVVVDGKPVHQVYNVKGVTVTHRMGETTQIYLELGGDVVLEGEGIVTQVVEGSVREWLEGLEPGVLADWINELLNAGDYDGAPYEELALRALKAHCGD